MEDDDIDTSSAGSLLPVALSVLAVVLGGAGLYFGLTANQRLSPLAETMDAGSSSAARLEKEISGLNTKIEELQAQSSELGNALSRVRLYSSQNEKAVKQLVSSVQENRSAVVEVAGRVNEMLTKTAQPEPPAPTPAPPSDRPEVPTPPPVDVAEATAAAGTYSIQSGDNFGKIATKLGVDLQALLDANPDADPRRLGIGQVINVPAN